ncbi:hypothetical protein BTN49_1905 [Candidatus Enterovibrio escicola]|uniref:Mobile element protein n=1 Tax=Candidatus Enterovibrio escicola TaxID=1927127 RepID=A0A2A5T2W9_9GAMM|nr:hypothetical protein BTN49_1905 [Candidatus Enterovibrio escacola]
MNNLDAILTKIEDLCQVFLIFSEKNLILGIKIRHKPS